MADDERRFEWDPAKAQSNKKKHGVSFELASLVFSDPLAQTEFEGIEHGEERWRTTGSVAKTLIVVSHTFRQDEDFEVVRIFSARKATRNERERFESQA